MTTAARPVLLALAALAALAGACEGRTSTPTPPEDAAPDGDAAGGDDVTDADAAAPADTGAAPADVAPDAPADAAALDAAPDAPPDAGSLDAAPDDAAPPDAAPDAPAPDAPDAPDDAAPDAPADAALDAAPRCRSDMDCAGMAGRGVCNRVTGACVGCLPTSDDCPLGRVCDPTMLQCVAGCRIAADCSPAAGVAGRPFCDVARRTCTECLTDASCPPGRVCRPTGCVPGCSATQPCPAGQACCAGACVDTAGDVTNCGLCGRVCTGARGTPGCAMGACTITCERPFGNCDGSITNGCETDLDTTPEHCGACGQRCAPTGGIGLCASGRCTLLSCIAPGANCDMLEANGCEANLQSDARNCGACGRACPEGQGCYAGACAVTISRYAVAAVSTPFVDVCSMSGRALVPVYGTSAGYPGNTAAIALPFSFRLFNTVYDRATVGVAGFVALGPSPASTTSYSPTTLPSTSLPRPALLAYTGPFYTRYGTVCSMTVGAGTERRFIVQWSNASFSSLSSFSTRMTFEVVLHEGTGLVEYVYQTLSGSGTSGENVVVGLQDEAAARATTYANRASGTVRPGLALRFTPAP